MSHYFKAVAGFGADSLPTLVGAIGALLILGACGGDGGRSPASAPNVPPVPAPVPNRTPMSVGAIPDQVLRVGDDPTTLDVAPYFSDPDGDPLTYTATSADTEVATVSVSGSAVSITGQSPGQVDLSVSARDSEGASATQSVSVTVEAAGFELTGTVTDGRANGPLVAGAVVRLGNGHTESVTTDSDGRYLFPNVAGTVSITVTAEPSYVAQTAQVTMDADRTVDFALHHTGIPPFAGTVFITPDILDASDPTSLGHVDYIGRRERQFWDRPAERWITLNVHLFDVVYDDQHVEFQVHPEFRSRGAARREVDRYAPVLGRLPVDLISGTREVEISVATGFVFQGNGSLGIIHIYTDGGENLFRSGFLEEMLFHEGGHVSLDGSHHDSAGWRAAQEADGVFISDYARDHPGGEDIAESILPWFAVRYRPERLTEADRSAILAAIPNRLAYFDEQGFDMSPYRARGAAARVR